MIDVFLYVARVEKAVENHGVAEGDQIRRRPEGNSLDAVESFEYRWVSQQYLLLL